MSHGSTLRRKLKRAQKKEEMKGVRVHPRTTYNDIFAFNAPLRDTDLAENLNFVVK